MRQARDRTRLGEKPRARIDSRVSAVAEHLDRDRTTQGLVDRLVDDAMPPGTTIADDSVTWQFWSFPR